MKDDITKVRFRLLKTLLPRFCFLLSVLFQFQCVHHFSLGNDVKIFQAHLFSILFIWLGFAFTYIETRVPIESIFLTSSFVWMTVPICGPVLSVIMFLICQKFKNNLSDLGEFLFNNAHASEDVSLFDKFSHLVKKLSLSLRPHPAALTVLDSGDSDAKFAMMNKIDKITDEMSSRIFRFALRDEDYDVQMFAAKKLSATEESFLDELRNLIRRIELLPDQIELRIEMLRQSLIFHNAKVCSTSVSEMWVKKALDISLPVEDEMQNGASYVLLGRTAMTVCRYDVALRAFNSAERFQGQSSIAKFYLAELFFRKKEYEETRRILTSLGESVELPPIMRDRVHYWTNAV